MKRLGLLIPSSNVVLEPLAAKRTDIQVHVTRLGVLTVKLDPVSQAQFAMDTHVAAAKLLHDAKVDGIVWGGTSASWLGVAHDEAFVARVEAETGIPTTTTVLEINRQLRTMGAKRIGLVTPYTSDVAQRINQNYETLGFEIGAWRADGGDLSNDFAKISEDIIEGMIRDVAQEKVDAIVIMCTNVAGARIASNMTEILRVPVLDSAIATLNLPASFWK
ncbi:maleate cis-trans isomerase family protein [Pacificibacter marinus]|uniref:maleate cis-trans isomerase family protein n=1 Tax=Pacificibacter marinus TaxID=658057 RepID=UPI001C076792|nr:aspartate/glutamate racemase family protein [Pacificibacter marinus]MBU2866033.1 Asp/Glu/hydantoin racemase [Pacificibacter marinus]